MNVDQIQLFVIINNVGIKINIPGSSMYLQKKKNSIKSVSGWSMYLQKKKISIKSVPGLFGQPVQERSFNTTLSLGYFGYKCAFGCFGSKIKAASPKNFCHAKRILTVKEVGRLSESVKKGKFMTNLFSHNVE